MSDVPWCTPPQKPIRFSKPYRFKNKKIPLNPHVLPLIALKENNLMKKRKTLQLKIRFDFLYVLF